MSWCYSQISNEDHIRSLQFDKHVSNYHSQTLIQRQGFHPRGLLLNNRDLEFDSNSFYNMFEPFQEIFNFKCPSMFLVMYQSHSFES